MLVLVDVTIDHLQMTIATFLGPTGHFWVWMRAGVLGCALGIWLQKQESCSDDHRYSSQSWFVPRSD